MDESIKQDLREIKQQVGSIHKALLGDLDTKSVGLVEQVRGNSKDIGELQKMAPQVEECVSFKKNIKLIAIGIAATVPFLIDAGKFICGIIWAALTTTPK